MTEAVTNGVLRKAYDNNGLKGSPIRNRIGVTLARLDLRVFRHRLLELPFEEPHRAENLAEVR